MNRLLKVAALAMFSFADTYGQVSRGVLYRVMMAQYNHERASIVAVEVDGREYWITAKHLLTGAKHGPFGVVTAKTVDLELLQPKGTGLAFLPEHFDVIDPGKDIDIVVLTAPVSVLDANSLPAIATESTGIVIGGPCHFVGYGLGGGWLAHHDDGSLFWRPFIKGCTVSGYVYELGLWVLDGYNVGGFSGGPVTFWKDGTDGSPQ